MTVPGPDQPGAAEDTTDASSGGGGGASWVRWVQRGLGVLALLLAVLLLFLTQTGRGRDLVVSMVENALRGAIDGELHVGRIVRGNLLTRAVIEEFDIRGRNGEPFVELDSVAIEYDPLGFLTGRIRFRKLEASRAEIRLTRAEDGLWNFQRIFGDTASSAGPAGPGIPSSADSSGTLDGDGLRLLIADAYARSGRIEIRQPWTPPAGPAGEAAVREVRAGRSMWRIDEPRPGSFVQRFTLEDFRGGFPLLRIIDPDRPLRLEMRGLSGRLEAVSDPLEVKHYDGSVVFGDSIRVNLDRLAVGESSLTGDGWVASGDPLAYHFDLDADPLALADVAWLPVDLPRQGGGPMGLRLVSRGETMVVRVTDADVRSRDTRLLGGFELALEDTPRFGGFDLEARPLRLSWLEPLLGRQLGRDGFVSGRVTGSGSRNALSLDADVTLTPVVDSLAPSRLRATGGISLSEPFTLRELALELGAFDLRWLEAIDIEPAVLGRLSGTATLNGGGAGPLVFQAALAHTGTDGERSRVSGGGTVDLEDGSVIDVRLQTDPLELSTLSSLMPDVRLVGSIRGPLEARGRLGDLQATADLETPRGRIEFTGRFDLESDPPSYDAEVRAEGLSLDQWLEEAPDSELAIRGRVQGRGIDAATLEGEFDLEILPSRLDQARIDSSLVRFRVADGLAVVDTFVIRSDVGMLGGRGSFGLDSTQTGPLVLEVTIEDLSTLDRWLLDDPAPGDAGPESLFAEGSRDTDDGPPPGAAGSVHALGAVFGNVDDFSVGGVIRANQPAWQEFSADSLVARFDLLDPRARDSLTLRVAATGARMGEFRADSVFGRYQRAGTDPASLDAYLRRDSTLELAARGTRVGPEDAYDIQLESLRVRVGEAEAETGGPARLVFSDREIRVENFDIAGPLGRVRADGRIPADQPGRLALTLEALDLGQLKALLTRPADLSGRLDANFELTGTIEDPAMELTFEVAEPRIGTHEYRELGGRLSYANRDLSGEVDLRSDDRSLARASGELRADLSLQRVERRLLEEPLDLRVEADSLPFELLELRVTGLEELQGVVTGQVDVSGRPGQLGYSGAATARGAGAWVPDLGVEFVDGFGSIRFRGSEATIDSFRVRSALGGQARVSGSVDVASFSDPTFDLDLQATRLLPIDRRDLTLVIEGEGHLGGRYRQPRIEGDFRLRDGDIRRDEVLRSQGVLDLSDPGLYGLLDTAFLAERRILERFQNPFMQNLVVDVTLALGPNLWMRSPELDVELTGSGLDVELDRSTQITRMVGIVRVERGTYLFDRLGIYRQQLRITGGEIQFVGNPGFNPNLGITAEYRTRTRDGPVQIVVSITGTLRNTQLAFSSSPPMSDSDQLCFLAVGSPCYTAADAGLGRRIYQQGLLGTVTSGLSSALVGSGGLGLSYFNLRTQDFGSGGVQGSESLFDRTEVEFGWYASDEVFLSVAYPLGGGVPRGAVEWRFADAWTLEARAESRLDRRQFGLFRTSNFDNEPTFGLFLFREWSY